MVAALLCLCIYAYLVPLTTLLVLIFCQLNFYPLRLVKVLYCCKGHTLSNRIKQKQKQTKKKTQLGLYWLRTGKVWWHLTFCLTTIYPSFIVASCFFPSLDSFPSPAVHIFGVEFHTWLQDRGIIYVLAHLPHWSSPGQTTCLNFFVLICIYKVPKE